MNNQDLVEITLQVCPEELLLPMVGTSICAGFPSPSDDYLEDPIDLNRLLIQRPAATFLWRVQGESMIEAGIHDGDILIVDRSIKPANGHVVIAYVNGEKSVKYLHMNGKTTLSFANSKLPPYQLSDGADVEIWGVVMWNLHNHIKKK